MSDVKTIRNLQAGSKAPSNPSSKTGSAAPGKHGKTGTKKRTPSLAAPTALNLNTNPTPRRDDPIWKDSVFGPELIWSAQKKQIPVAPNCVGLVPLVGEVYNQLKVDTPTIDKNITRESLRYYATGLLWLRIINLKQLAKKPLSKNEVLLLNEVESARFFIPKPLLVYLTSLGEMRTHGGDAFELDFPPIPDKVVDRLGGFFGTLNNNPTPDTVVNYTELPCLGLAAEALMKVMAKTTDDYASRISNPNRPLNSNCQGYEPLNFCREEARNTLRSWGITAQKFDSKVGTTAYNKAVMSGVSTFLSTTKTFSLVETTIANLGSTGSQALVIPTKPAGAASDMTTKYWDTTVVATSLYSESHAAGGLAMAFGFQLFKEAIASGQNAHKNWSPIDYPEGTPVPQGWVDARNSRRNLPECYYDSVHIGPALDAEDCLKRLVTSMILTSRQNS